LNQTASEPQNPFLQSLKSLKSFDDGHWRRLAGSSAKKRNYWPDFSEIGIDVALTLLGARYDPFIDLGLDPCHRRPSHADTAREAATLFPAQKARITHSDTHFAKVFSTNKYLLMHCLRHFKSPSGLR
ncbi:hypothetical protein, partial [Ensifer soli]